MNIEKKLIDINYTKGVKIKPEFIVVHETGNTKKGANADAHYRYWSTDANANSSVHFVCDDHKVIQLAELDTRCWHVGDNKGHSNITNSNSIGLEICINSDGDYMKARQNAIELVTYLLSVTKLTPDKVVRHYDSSGKNCPTKMLEKPELWTDFKKQVSVTQPLTLSSAIDILAQKGLINSPDYWKQNAVAGKTVNGEWVGILIQRVAETPAK